MSALDENNKYMECVHHAKTVTDTDLISTTTFKLIPCGWGTLSQRFESIPQLY